MDQDDESREGRSRTIGSLASGIVSSLVQRDGAMSGSTGRGHASETFTSARAISLPTTRQRGEPGSAMQPALSLDAIMAQDDPEATDRHILRLLPPSVASALRTATRDFIDERYGYDFEIVGYSLDASLVAEDDRQEGERLLGYAMAPASVQVIQEALARLRAGTKARSEAVGDLAMTMQVLAEECAEYPPDVVRSACRRWMRRERWFPSVAELRDEMQRLARHREMIERAIRREDRASRRYGR